ncbi:DNA-binding transcriptional regulator [Undibacterium sp. FT31W]|uniref:DNA-binding transcriptional regulator n=2 Tax=Undibacterium griseum TaxID=2762295 RepID=A0ABR6YRV6_9BURK|nr:DNA-binding transcriptional regulator [Undibacterium griseum]
MDGGLATSQQIADVTGMHRTTVRRLLETLVEEGYVRRSNFDDSFRLMLSVRGLSEGFTDVERIATVAPPIMGRLLQRITWPSDLTTPDGDAMIIRETTHRFSPLSFHRAMVGRRLPMLLTAAGRAYFGMCHETEQEEILNLLRAGVGGQQQAIAKNDALVRALIKRIIEDGYGSNHGDWDAQAKIGALAVPIYSESSVRGSINVVFLNRAVSQKEAELKFLPELLQAAAQISTAMHERD